MKYATVKTKDGRELVFAIPDAHDRRCAQFYADRAANERQLARLTGAPVDPEPLLVQGIGAQGLAAVHRVTP